MCISLYLAIPWQFNDTSSGVIFICMYVCINNYSNKYCQIHFTICLSECACNHVSWSKFMSKDGINITSTS